MVKTSLFSLIVQFIKSQFHSWLLSKIKFIDFIKFDHEHFLFTLSDTFTIRNEYSFAWSKFEKLFEDHFEWENN